MQANQQSAGNRLRELREQHGMRLLDVAKLVDRDPSVVSGYETGRVALAIDHARILASHYGVTVEYLMGWDRESVEGAGAAA